MYKNGIMKGKKGSDWSSLQGIMVRGPSRKVHWWRRGRQFRKRTGAAATADTRVRGRRKITSFVYVVGLAAKTDVNGTVKVRREKNTDCCSRTTLKTLFIESSRLQTESTLGTRQVLSVVCRSLLIPINCFKSIISGASQRRVRSDLTDATYLFRFQRFFVCPGPCSKKNAKTAFKRIGKKNYSDKTYDFYEILKKNVSQNIQHRKD